MLIPALVLILGGVVTGCAAYILLDAMWTGNIFWGIIGTALVVLGCVILSVSSLSLALGDLT